MSWSVIRKNVLAVFKVKVRARAYIIKIWLFLLYLLNCWSICGRTWFYGTFSYAAVSCEKKKGLMCSRLRSPWNFKTSVNFCQENIFWSTEPFATKLGIYWCIISSRSKKTGLLSSRSRSQWRLYMVKLLLSLCLLNCWSFCNQSRFHSMSWIAFWKAQIVSLCSRSQQGFKISLNIHLVDIFSAAEPFVTNLVWWCSIMGQSVLWKNWFVIFKATASAKINWPDVT